MAAKTTKAKEPEFVEAAPEPKPLEPRPLHEFSTNRGDWKTENAEGVPYQRNVIMQLWKKALAEERVKPNDVEIVIGQTIARMEKENDGWMNTFQANSSVIGGKYLFVHAPFCYIRALSYATVLHYWKGSAGIDLALICGNQRDGSTKDNAFYRLMDAIKTDYQALRSEVTNDPTQLFWDMFDLKFNIGINREIALHPVRRGVQQGVYVDGQANTFYEATTLYECPKLEAAMKFPVYGPTEVLLTPQTYQLHIP